MEARRLGPWSGLGTWTTFGVKAASPVPVSWLNHAGLPDVVTFPASAISPGRTLWGQQTEREPQRARRKPVNPNAGRRS
jgi:hypothetical protein